MPAFLIWEDLKMARKNTAKIITDTAEQENKNISGSAGNAQVCIACGLPLGIKFDDVDNGNGGFKTIVFPGINHALVGKASGILLGSGNAVLVTIDANDWEDIKRKHGKERAFTSVPPLLMVVKDKEEFSARKNEDISEMKTGVDPVKPEDEKVEKA